MSAAPLTELSLPATLRAEPSFAPRSPTVRSASARAESVAGDILSLEIRAGFLFAEVQTLQARYVGLRGYGDTAPLVGDARYGEAAGVAAGAAIARMGSCGPEDLAGAVRSAATAIGATDKVSSLLDVAGAAIAWAVRLSLAELESSAASPVISTHRAGRAQLPSRVGDRRSGRQPAPLALERVRAGELSARDLLLGRASATERRDLAHLPLVHVLIADPGVRVDLGGLSVHPQVRIGELSIDQRHDLAQELVLARERDLAVAA